MLLTVNCRQKVFTTLVCCWKALPIEIVQLFWKHQTFLSALQNCVNLNCSPIQLFPGMCLCSSLYYERDTIRFGRWLAVLIYLSYPGRDMVWYYGIARLSGVDRTSTLVVDCETETELFPSSSSATVVEGAAAAVAPRITTIVANCSKALGRGSIESNSI